MKTKRNRIFIGVFSVCGLLFLALPLFRPSTIPVFLLLVGRAHPVVLHFPIVLIILAFLFELAGRFHYLKKTQPIVRVLLIAASLSTVVAAGAGFFLFSSGDYSGELMERHFWAGSITGAAIMATAALFFVYRQTGNFYPVYMGTLIVSTLAVGYTGHVGGTITHGKDFLTAYLPAILNDWKVEKDKPESEMMVYEDVITPVLEFKCAGCHNATRSKGGFVVSPFQKIMKPGESGHPSITAKSLEKSELFKRVTMPDTTEDHMPPQGKTPLSEHEIALLKFWIESGAPEKQPVAEARQSEPMEGVINDLLTTLGTYHRKTAIAKMNADEVKHELGKVAQKLSVSIHSDASGGDDFFTVAMTFPPAMFTEDQLQALLPYGDHFSRISLVSSGIHDEALYYIAQMGNVKELYLQKTGLDGSGLIYLQTMPNLEILNLSFTNVDDKAIIDLLRFPRLREVYLYRTKVSIEVVEAIRKNRPDLRIALEEGPYL